MLGRDVMLAAANAGHDVVGFGHTELDVTDAAAVEQKLEAERPDVVINCAAWTDVDGAEEAEEEAMAVNGTGAGNIAAAAAERRSHDRLRLQRLRLRRRQGRALRGERPAGAALGLRAHEAGRRGGDRGRQPAPLHRPLLLAVRHRRPPTSSRRCCAWPPITARSSSSATRSARPTYTWHLAHGIVRLSRASSTASTTWPPPGPAHGMSSRARSSSRPGSSAKCSRRRPRCSAARRRGRPTRRSPASASTRSGCPPGRMAWPATSANEREAKAVKILVTGAAGFIGSTYVRLVEDEHEVTGARQADLRRAAREPARRMLSWSSAGSRTRRSSARRWRAPTRSSTSPPSPTSIARSRTRTPSPAPT